MNDLTIYNSVKHQMQTGDLLQWRSESLIGALIRWRTLSEWNHSSLVVSFQEYQGTEGRRFTTEALSDGVVLNLLSNRLERHKGNVWWYPLDEEKCPVKRPNIGELALKYIGTGYDYQSILRLVLRRVSNDAAKLFCSEYVAICYGHEGQAMTPADLPHLNIFKEPVRLI